MNDIQYQRGTPELLKAIKDRAAKVSETKFEKPAPIREAMVSEGGAYSSMQKRKRKEEVRLDGTSIHGVTTGLSTADAKTSPMTEAPTDADMVVGRVSRHSIREDSLPLYDRVKRNLNMLVHSKEYFSATKDVLDLYIMDRLHEVLPTMDTEDKKEISSILREVADILSRTSV